MKTAVATAKSAKSEEGYCEDDAACAKLADGYACVIVHTTRENTEDVKQCMPFKAPGDVCAGVNPGLCPSFSTWSKEFKSINRVCSYILPTNQCANENAVTDGAVACLNATASSNLATYGVTYGCVDYDGTRLLLKSTSKSAMMVAAFNYSAIISAGCVSPKSAAGSNVLCSGRGTCAPKAAGQMDYTCLCNVGYSGTYCQKIESNKCTMKAQCTAGTCNLASQECECEPGTKGNQCAECDPASANACNKRGTCTPVLAPDRRFLANAADSSASASSSMVCTCESGFAGAHCDRVLPSTPSPATPSIRNANDEPTNDKTSMTIAIVAGAIVLVAVITTLIACRRRRRRSRADKLNDEFLSPSTRDMGSTAPGYAPSQSTTSEQRNTAHSGAVGQNAAPLSESNGSRGISTGTGSSRATARSSDWSQFVPQGGLWDDDVIVAARVPREKVLSETLLSRGGFGEVYRGMYNGQVVAIKTLLPEARKNMKQINAFLSEIRLMASLEHERIVTFIGVAWDSLADLCVVSEFMSGGDLRSVLAGFKQSARPQGFDHDKVKVAVHIAHALTYLHSLQPIVLHRDLKSKNILLDDHLNTKLTDFGVSRERSDRTMTAGIGSSLWMAPEVMLGGRYDDKADVFSFGVVLSELDSQELPYAHVTESSGSTSSPRRGRRRIPETAMLQMISSGRLRVRFSSDATPAIVALGSACVALDPKDRPTAAQALFTLHTALRSL